MLWWKERTREREVAKVGRDGGVMVINTLLHRVDDTTGTLDVDGRFHFTESGKVSFSWRNDIIYRI